MTQFYVQNFGTGAGSVGLNWEQGISADPHDQAHNLCKGD